MTSKMNGQWWTVSGEWQIVNDEYKISFIIHHSSLKKAVFGPPFFINKSRKNFLFSCDRGLIRASHFAEKNIDKHFPMAYTFLGSIVLFPHFLHFSGQRILKVNCQLNTPLEPSYKITSGLACRWTYPQEDQNYHEIT